MKTLERIYNNSKEAQTAIFNNTYKYSQVCKRVDFVKDNVRYITHINGEPIVVNDICRIDVYGNDISYFVKKDSVMSTHKLKPISIIDITFKN